MISAYVWLAIGVAMAIWGGQTRGNWSQNMSIAGGTIWIVTLAIILASFGIGQAFMGLLFSFVAAGICKGVFPQR